MVEREKWKKKRNVNMAHFGILRTAKIAFGKFSHYVDIIDGELWACGGVTFMLNDFFFVVV